MATKKAEAASKRKRAENRDEIARPAEAPLETKRAGMRILEFHAENFMRLEVVDITPKGNMVVLKGKNGSGKTSILDAIECVLRGTTNLPAEPINRKALPGKDGLRRSVIKIGTEEYTLIRRMVEGGQRGGVLEVWSRDGKTQHRGAQGLLDELMRQISFDPLAFMRMKPDAQLKELQGVVQVDIDLDALAAQRKTDYDERRRLGKETAEYEALRKAHTIPEDLPEGEVDVTEIGARLAAVGEANLGRAKLAEKKAAFDREAKLADEKAADLEREMEEMETRLKHMKGAWHVLQEKAVEARVRHDAIEVPKLQSSDALQAELAEAKRINEHIGARTTVRNLDKRIARNREAELTLTEKLKSYDQEREQAIARAKMPVKGLDFGDGSVLYNGLPFDQASDGEKIRVAVALGMAANPVFRVLRIKDGSLLDEEALGEIERMAEAENFQVWIELVGNSSKSGFVIAEGKVVKS